MAVITGTVNLNAAFTEIISSGVITSQNLPANLLQSLSYTNGTGSGQVDLIYAKQLSLAGTATTLDLTALTDLAGGAVAFARVRELWIQNLATTAAYTVTVGAAAATQFVGFLGTTTSTVIIPTNVGATGNYAMHRFCDPYTTGASTGAYVDSTHKSLKLDPGANTISVNVLILGCSAQS